MKANGTYLLEFLNTCIVFYLVHVAICIIMINLVLIDCESVLVCCHL